MKIGIDISQTAFPGSGVARYTQNLALSLLDESARDSSLPDEYSFFFSSLRKSPPEEILKAIRSPHSLMRMFIPPTLLAYLWNHLHLVPVETFMGKLDVYISSDWTQPPVRHAKSVTIIHDMIPYLYPETSTTQTHFRASNLTIQPNIVATHIDRLAWVAQECDCIIADSHSTKRDIMSCLDIPPDIIQVVYPAVEVIHATPSAQAQVRSSYGLSRPYLLTVGKIEPRKNIPALIQAFAQSGLWKSHDLALVGAQGWGDASQALDVQPEALSALKWLGFVPDPDLFALYAQADQCVMPSLYEGFGFPIIEAMAMGCPVACSHTSSLGELGNGYAELFDPLDIDDIADTIVRLQKSIDAKTYDSHSAQTYAQTFTRKRFADDIHACLTSVVY